MGMGDRIRTAREAKGITQAGLASLVGVHENTINRWENSADAQIKSRDKGLLVASLGINLEWLEKGSGQMEFPRDSDPVPPHVAPQPDPHAHIGKGGTHVGGSAEVSDSFESKFAQLLLNMAEDHEIPVEERKRQIELMLRHMMELGASRSR